ncbi:MAG TPA: NAD(P)-dependent oxidoreductase [Methylomirabilota bacterium]|nr:NAD(P)-dependent oxidoreductase [Methylomirabilota bacterium]
MQLSFVGTGNMGRPMAENMIRAGHRLTVYDLDPGATAPLEALGAARAASLPEAARAASVTFLSLPDARAVEAAVLGEAAAPGLLAGARPGHMIFDLSTVGPDSTRALAARCAERGVKLIDAPVSGSVSGARAGTLAVMVGTAAEAVGEADAAFRAIGRNIFYLGELGRGNILKLLNNYVALAGQAVLCEALALADRLGVPRQTVGDVLLKSSGASFILERKLAAFVVHDYRPGFFVDLAWKDLGLGLELGERAGARMDMGREAWRLYGQAREAGLGQLDSAGLLGLLEPGESTARSGPPSRS